MHGRTIASAMQRSEYEVLEIHWNERTIEIGRTAGTECRAGQGRHRCEGGWHLPYRCRHSDCMVVFNVRIFARSVKSLT